MAVQYIELVIHGPFHLAKGFVYGMMFAKAPGKSVLINSEHDIRRTSLSEMIKDWFGYHGDLTHLIVEEQYADDIVIALNSTKETLGLELKSQKRIKAAAFNFTYRAFAKYYGDALQAIFDNLPKGLTISSDYKPEVIQHPDATGVEGYAPEHDYVLSAHGTVEGPFEEILAFHKHADKEELIEAENIELLFG